MLADNLASTGLHRLRSGEIQAALRDSQRALQISTRIGNLWGQAYARWPIATAHLVLGELGPAITVLRECVAYGDRAGFVVAQYAGRAYLVTTLSMAGAVEQAEAILREAKMARGGRDEILLQHLNAAEAWYAARQGDPERADLILRPIVGEVFERLMGEDPFLLPAAVLETLLAFGRFDDALRRLDSIEAGLSRMGVSALAPMLVAIRARALVGLGRTEDARLAFQRSLHAARAAGIELGRWEVESELARLAEQAGDHAEARAMRRSGRVHAEAVAAGLEPLGLDAAFRRLPAVRRLLADGPE
jgi:tetratricopeptide (TPR) repeat protein